MKPSLSCSSTIFKMAAAEEVECVDEHMHPDINELLSKGIHRYTILYDKTLKEAKDQKMKSNAWKKITFPVTQPKLFGKVIILAIGSSCFLLKLNTGRTLIFLDVVVLFWRLFLLLLI